MDVGLTEVSYLDWIRNAFILITAGVAIGLSRRFSNISRAILILAIFFLLVIQINYACIRQSGPTIPRLDLLWIGVSIAIAIVIWFLYDLWKREEDDNKDD